MTYRKQPIASQGDSKHKPRPLLSIAVVLVIASALILHFSFYAFSIRRITAQFMKTPFTGTAKCILYDRPRRTGSTTISRKLRYCTREKEYTRTGGFRPDKRDYAVRYMLNSSDDKLALVGPHICISRADIKRLKNRCGSLLFISSTTPMKDRLLSSLKFRMISQSGNSTITEDHLSRMQAILNRSMEEEERIEEKYPYCNNPLPIKPNYALQPDYVIRSEHMSEDFPPLLKALGCSPDFQTNNVHTTSVDMKDLSNKIKLKYADRSHIALSKLAEMNNARGLEKALLF